MVVIPSSRCSRSVLVLSRESFSITDAWLSCYRNPLTNDEHTNRFSTATTLGYVPASARTDIYPLQYGGKQPFVNSGMQMVANSEMPLENEMRFNSTFASVETARSQDDVHLRQEICQLQTEAQQSEASHCVLEAAGFEDAAHSFAQAARDQVDIGCAHAKARTQANMVSDLLRTEQTEQQVSTQLQLFAERRNERNYSTKRAETRHATQRRHMREQNAERTRPLRQEPAQVAEERSQCRSTWRRPLCWGVQNVRPGTWPTKAPHGPRGQHEQMCGARFFLHAGTLALFCGVKRQKPRKNKHAVTTMVNILGKLSMSCRRDVKHVGIFC